MRFLDFNYVIQSNVTLTASSSQVAFPITNLRSHFRNKVWRSNGTFIIDSTNNKIDFRETNGGPEITVTISTGTFTPTTLTAEIASKMTAGTLNARTYTVSFSLSTGKWTIAGETFLELLWLTGTNTATSIGPSIGFAVTDLTGAITYDAASRAIHTEESIVINLNTAEEIDSIVFFPNLLEHTNPEGFRLTDQAVVRFQASATDVWDSPPVNQILTLDEQFGISSHFFTAANEFRFQRLQIVDPKNPFLFVEVGALVIAKGTVLTDPPENGFNFSNVDTSVVVRNSFGNEYTDDQPIMKSMDISYTALQYDDVKTLDRMFKRNGTRIPVTVVLDEAEECYDKDHFLVYGKFQNNLEHEHISFILFNQGLSFREIL